MTDLSTWGYEQGSPSNTVEEVKEYSAEDNYEQFCSENEVSTPISEYVTSLERKLKSVKAEVKVLHDTAEGIEGATYWENNLKNILLKFNTY